MVKKGLKSIEMGQILSIDLMLALILITVLLGVSADAMDLISSRMDDNTYAGALERITAENVNVLINTPGIPENWEEGRQLMQVVKPGLADVNLQTGSTVNKTLSMKKILKLKDNYRELINGKIVPSGFNSNIIFYPVNNSLESIQIGDIEPKTAGDVFVINRTVMCNYEIADTMVAIVSSEKKDLFLNSSSVVCPHCNLSGNIQHPYNESISLKSGWKCQPFIITQTDINANDIYLMTDPPLLKDTSACWIVDSTKNMTDSREKFGSSPIRLNDRISTLTGENTNSTIWIHVYSSGSSDEIFDVYIAKFPKGTPYEQIKTQYLTPQPYYLIFKVWI
ncbi:MAG TPA: hypothetical protein VK444_01880 [Methanobacteriaceae archaeon]|nr:hypothetical protein [Methanobacteriaceae archaeon]